MALRYVSALIFFLITVSVAIYAEFRFKKRVSMQKPLPKIRRIAAVDAIRDAVGRAVEMGRPVCFTAGGNAKMPDLETPTLIASVSLLRYVARLCAEYNAPLIVPVLAPETIPLLDEAIRESYLSVGKPEAYDPINTIRYLTTEPMAYSTGYMDIVTTEKPGANMMIGALAGQEPIIAGEAGARVGAIQIGGSSRTASVGSVAVMMDYFMVGEEVFAAGAYVSADPTATSSLFATDFTRVLVVALTILGAVLLNVAGSRIIVNLLNV
jgi:hypothetical protein